MIKLRAPFEVQLTRFDRSMLLQPSLSAPGQVPRAAPYSATTGYISSFFGGPYAALIVVALNVHRLGRWREDATWLAFGLALALAWSLWLPGLTVFADIDAILRAALGQGAWRYAERAFSLGLFAVLHWRHRRIDRASDLFALNRPSGWVAGLAAIVCGTLVAVLLAMTKN